MVAFGMHGGVVQRVVRTRDAQEACALFKSLVSEPLDLKQLFTRTVRTIFRPVFDNILRKGRPYARNVA